MLLLLLLLCCGSIFTFGQSTPISGGGQQATIGKTFIICMRDTNMIFRSTTAPYPIVSYRPQVQAILDNYTLYSIKKAYPDSRLQSTRSFYEIRANSLNLMHQLLAWFPAWFPSGFEARKGVPLYEPLEFFNGSGCDTFLRYINADGAWDYSHGDPNVVIGISDTWFDVTNPDLVGRIERVDNSNTTVQAQSRPHGTETAGFIVGNMDDGGLVGVGGFCKIDASSFIGSDDVMLSFSAGSGDSVPPRKIINGSWQYPSEPSFTGYSCDSVYTGDYFPTRQQIYNEIYENGTATVFAAGNGGKGSPACGSITVDSPYTFEEADVRAFMFPASFDHVFSVSGVGFNPNHVVSYNGIVGATGSWNWSDVHRLNATDPATSMQHNSRVDLLAPSYLMPGLTYDPNDPNKHTSPGLAGTSYSAPMVSGTIGLMQSVANQCLSPYQVEYLLKISANTDVFSQPENAAYAGMLGAGVLDAGKAVAMTDTFDCNDPATQTFVIKGVEINTICAPGYSSNGVQPKLTPVLENGTPPYTYKWTPRHDANSGTLDSYDIAEPTVVSPVWGWFNQQQRLLIEYRLVVTDNSPVPKVANREVTVYFDTSGYDIAMRDGPMDFFTEPYLAGVQDPRELIWWTGTDIWNRRTLDGGLDHQDPEYFDTDSNHLYTRIRNVGCEASPSTAKLRLYWTLQSTGEDWDSDWTTADFPGNPNLPAGREITATPMPIPALQPGGQVILEHGWRSQQPSDYDENLEELNACVLARIEESPNSPYGMTYPETMNEGVGINVKNNNNIITRNLNFVNLAPGNVVPENLVIIGNPAQNSRTYQLQLMNNRGIHRQLSGNFSAIGFVRIRLGQKLYDRWMNSGGKGRYTATDNRAYTVDFDGADIGSLEGITLQAGERIPVFLQFLQREGAVTTGMDYTFHLVQSLLQPDPENPAQDPMTGGVTFTLRTKDTRQAATILKKGALPQVMEQRNCKVYPNPARNNLYIESSTGIKALTLCDMAGRLLYRNGADSKELNLQPFKAGIYILSVTDTANHTERFKIVKQ